jgi:hypothetical protein
MIDDVFNSDREFDAMSREQLFEILGRGGTPRRARAMAALARKASLDDGLVDQVLEEIESASNRSTRVMGTVSLSHIGFGCLWERGNVVVQAKLEQQFAVWPEPDRSDLSWFLKSQGLSQPNRESPIRSPQ